MPTAKSQGLNIYYEVEGSGQPLVLAHGLSMSLEDWKDHGYIEALSDKFMVILVDSRGHGHSDKPHDPTLYTRHNRGLDLIAVLDDLGIDNAHYVGYSLGGSACLAAVSQAPDRWLTLSMGGFQPFNADEIPDDIPPHSPEDLIGLPSGEDPVRFLLSQGSAAWIAFFKANMDVSQAMASRLAKNDYAALIACRDQPEGKSITQKLDQLNLPCLIYVGDQESVYRGAQFLARRLPGAEFVSLTSFNHFEVFAESKTIIPILRQFLDKHSDRL